ncbi:hypothetical protein L195_g013910 [Trifolium pratense]|uniref:Uncharacterized protein n=1 Tax=Trifolium pratense TaxID=57577 RepID=A0A2K3PPF0_TRIPR|nr:hypothetical protein L195_g013910 [Trifolium pratense]
MLVMSCALEVVIMAEMKSSAAVKATIVDGRMKVHCGREEEE